MALDNPHSKSNLQGTCLKRGGFGRRKDLIAAEKVNFKLEFPSKHGMFGLLRAHPPSASLRRDKSAFAAAPAFAKASSFAEGYGGRDGGQAGALFFEILRRK